MKTRLPSPVLCLAVDAVMAIQSDDVVCGLWNVFTKCKDSLEDGSRLENISWRLWHRQMALDADAKRVSRADQAVRSATNLSNTLSEEEDETDTSSTSDSESDSDIQSEKEEAVAPVKSTTTTPVLPDSRKSYSRAPSPRLTPKSSSSTAPPPASGDRQRRHSHRQTQFHHNHNHHQRRPRHVSFPTTTHPSSPRRPTLSSRANSDPTGSPPHLHPIPIGRLIRDIIPDRIARSLPVATGHAESHRSPALASDVVSDSGYGEAPAKDTSSGTRIPTRTPASPPSIEAAPPTPPTRLLVVSSSSPSAAAYADASGNIRAAAASDLAPRLVIVNPTPHPTPPATPEVAEPPQVTGFGSQSNAPPHSHRSLSTTSNSSGSLSPPPITMIISKTSPLRNPSSALGVQQKPLSVKPPLARSFSSSSSTSESVDSRRGGQEGIFFLHKSTSSLSPVREITQLPLPPDAMLTNIAQLENKRDGKSRIKEKEGDHDAIPKSEVAVPVSAIATTSAAPTTELHNIAEGNEHTSVASSHARSVGSNKSRGGKLAKEKEKEPGKGKAKEVIKTSGAKSKLGMRQTKGLTGLTMTAAHPAGHAGKHAPSGVRVEKKVRMNSSSRERGPSAERRTSHGANGKGKGKETAHVKPALLRSQTAPLPLPQITQIDARHIAQPPLPNGKGRKVQLVDSTSSEFYSDEDVDEEGWTSELDEGEDTKKKGKAPAPKKKSPEELAAEAAAKDREMFAKLPTRSYTDLAKRTKSGLLSELFHPNPNRFPEGHPYRTSLSHQDIVAKGWNPGGPALYGASTRFPTSKSSAALPQMAVVTAESVNSKNGIVGPASVKANSGPTAATTSTGSGPSMRPRGRPANVEEEDSDTDGEEDNTLSKSLVQRKLESLVASNNKRSGSASAKSPVAGVDAQSRPSASNGVMGGAMNGTRDRRQSAPEDTTPAVPITLGYPYNLPLPPPPQSPAAIRRQMLANEMSESVRRNVLWEKRQGRNFKMRQQMLTQAQAAHPHGYGYGNGNTNGINGSEGRPDDGRHNRQAYMNRNKSWAPAGNGW